MNTTAPVGSTEIHLEKSVAWPLGSQIVIATTGDKLSVGETEIRTIISKSSDNATLTLDSGLSYQHLSEKRTVGSGMNKVVVQIKAEVGLLTRNVVFKGSKDDTWSYLMSSQSCPSGFDPSEFAVQTCFLGRYGPELGTDQFGATIIINSERKLQTNEAESVIVRLSNVELNHVGQSFRLDRYPIYFQQNGNMPSSYVVECSIYDSFNRATNIHDSNFIRIERNVIYNIMGSAHFLEEGTEIGNIYQYNLAILVKSSSLINEDLTPGLLNFYLTKKHKIS